MKILISFLFAFLIWASVATAGRVVHQEEVVQSNAVYIIVKYRVSDNETLDMIADKFIKKNTYGKREHNEFRQGIIELNPWLTHSELKRGYVLEIRYWRKK